RCRAWCSSASPPRSPRPTSKPWSSPQPKRSTASPTTCPADSGSSPPAPTPCSRTPSTTNHPMQEEKPMRFVAPPTHVGEDQWPVLSAVRVNTADDPAEFVVLVDCGEGTPLHPYATLQVFIWTKRRTRRKVGDGEYNLTFEQARRSLAQRAGLAPARTTTVELVVVRDPDTANDYAVFVDGVRRPDG